MRIRIERVCKGQPGQQTAKANKFPGAGPSTFFKLASEFNRSYYHPQNRTYVFPSRLSGEAGWDIVKRAIFAIYDVSDVASLPDGERDEINAFAMSLTDILFKQLRERAKEYKRTNFLKGEK